MIPADLFAAAIHPSWWKQGSTGQFRAFASDSREVQPEDLFVAVHGMHTDGHNFIHEAISRGATGIVVEQARVETDAVLHDAVSQWTGHVFAVPDVRLALRRYAAEVIRTWHPYVIAVAGSAGKTTTKEAVGMVLETTGKTFRSWLNFNDLLGVPLSLGHLGPDHVYAVLEFGCDVPGEIAALCDMAPVDVAVILNAYATHTDGLTNEDGIAQELAILAKRAKQIVMPDDPLLRKHIDRPAHWIGLTSTDTVTGIDNPSDHLVVSLNSLSYDFPNLHGNHWINTVKAALTVGIVCGVPSADSARQIASLQPLPGRMRVLDGIQGIRIIDDTHNAIPVAVEAALTELSRAGKLFGVPRVAILGDMLHLGSLESALHAYIGSLLPAMTDWVIAQGPMATVMAQAAIQAGMQQNRLVVTASIGDSVRALHEILEQQQKLPLVLVKGSSELRMEQIVQSILAQPALSPFVLDRQRSIWQRAIIMEPNRPTWLEIDVEAIAQNTRMIRSMIGPDVRVMATLKADAYGHGAVRAAHAVLRNGATWLGVATVSEAVILRQSSIQAPILVYGYIPPWQAREAALHDLRCTLYALDTAQALSRAAMELHVVINVHVKIDTGMGRLGIRAEDIAGIVAFVQSIAQLPGLYIEGIYTHFATADASDKHGSHMQLQRFRAVLAALEAVRMCPPIIHAANSAATISLPEAHFSLVRPGIALFGLNPSADTPLPTGFRPALSFKTQIAQVKEIPAGEGISYGWTYCTEVTERVAILPVGYADGFRRGPRNWGSVLIHGKRAPIRGRVCMDQVIVSVDHIADVRAGDEVVLIGEQDGASITVDEIAEEIGTINYEVIAALLARVPRLA